MMSAPLSQFPASVEIVEVGLRDGFQTLTQLIPVDKKLELIQKLIKAGVKNIQVTSFVHPKRVPQMADAEELCARLSEFEGVTFSGLALNKKGVERAQAAGLKVIDVGFAATETMSQKNAGCSISEALARQDEMIQLARSSSMSVRAGVQVAFGCVYEGDVPQSRVVDLVEQTLAMGIDELSLADTTGMANPAQIEQMLQVIKPLAKDIPIVLHLHDTRGLGLANVYAALRQGVNRFDTSFGGLGGCPFVKGATGNIATEDSVNLMNELGIETGIDIKAIAGISQDLEQFLNTALPAKMHHLVAV